MIRKCGVTFAQQFLRNIRKAFLGKSLEYVRERIANYGVREAEETSCSIKFSYTLGLKCVISFRDGVCERIEMNTVKPQRRKR